MVLFKVTGLMRSSLAVRYAILVGVAGVVLGLDQISKAVVMQWLQGHRPVSLLGGAVHLDYARNTGAAFSVLPNGSALFEAAAVVACLGILIGYARIRTPALLVQIALGLILGGALGNLVDRVRLGYVVDFIDLRWWPVFNLADSTIVVGVSLLAVRSVLQRADE